MSFKSALLAASAAIAFALPALAADIIVMDPYARSASASAKTGAAFMVIHNHGAIDDRLIGVASPAAKKVELHTHIEDASGVMKMTHVEEGFALPSDGMIMMKRGGHHVMFMGLTAPFDQGNMVPVTLIFETAGEIEIEVPVDLERKDDGMGHDHSMEKSE